MEAHSLSIKPWRAAFIDMFQRRPNDAGVNLTGGKNQQMTMAGVGRAEIIDEDCKVIRENK